VPLVRIRDDLEVIGDRRFTDFWSRELEGCYVPELLSKLVGETRGEGLRGVRDDNRSAILPNRRTVIGGREFVAAVKGCGAATDAYENVPLTASRVRAICRDDRFLGPLSRPAESAAGFITGERWFGNTPYGGQAADNAAIALMTSLRSNGAQIAGFAICPVVALVRLPEEFAKVASRFWWYRRYDGAYWQEIRLMPSNVRVYFHSPVTFGVDTSRVFALFGIESPEQAEHFLENLARSCVAALTLFARSLRWDDRRGVYAGLGYHDVWLDKDAVVAGDGRLHFADLEGIEEVAVGSAEAVREQILAQFHRNVYEAFYALEAMALEVDRRWRLLREASSRRGWILDAVRRSSDSDPHTSFEMDGDRLVLRVDPAVDRDVCDVEIEIASGEEG
jgi:hypothetical protein